MTDAPSRLYPDTESALDRVLGNLLAKILSHEAVNEAMQDAWNDICSDTGCHPLDVEHGRSKQLTFKPNHWANQVAKRLFVRALKLRLEMPDLETCHVCQGSGYSNHPDSGEVCHACGGKGGVRTGGVAQAATMPPRPHSIYSQFHLDNWTDDDFAKHPATTRKTLEWLLKLEALVVSSTHGEGK